MAAAPRPAIAQSGSTLEDLVQEGIRLRRDGHDEQALEVLRKAEQLQPTSVRVLLHLATAAQAAGHWLEADTYIRRVFQYRDDPYYRRYQNEIASVEELIESRIGRFQAAGSPAGAEVRLNGRVIGTLPMAEPYRVEAGVYQIEVVSGGYYSLQRSERIPGGVLTREIIDLDREHLGATETSATAASVDPDAWWRKRWVGWTLGGIGAASAISAGISFAVREQKASEWNDDSRCVLPGGRTREQTCGGDYGGARLAERIGVASTVSAVLFGSAAVLQLEFLSKNDKPEKAPSPQPDASPAKPSEGASASCGPTWLGVTCVGAF